MINPNFVIFGALLNLIGGLSYFIETLKGRVKPNRVTWLLWAIAPLVAFSGQLSQGVGILALITFMAGFIPLIIFAASFVNKKAYWKLGWFDFTCGILAAIGLAGWYATKSGNVAILFGILADGLAALPTIVKSYKAPETEDYRIYALGAISALITLLAITTWTFEFYAFPLYILGLTLLILLAMFIGKKKKMLKR
jgi:uncharacterized membrane protein